MITRDTLEDGLADVLDYKLVTAQKAELASETEEKVSEQEEKPEEEQSALVEENEDPNPAGLLGGLEGISLTLANGQSSGQVKVVNLYAESNGSVNTEPLEEVLSGGSIDVSDCLVVVNVVAQDAEVFSWTTDAAGTPQDIAPYLIPGGTYRLTEVSTPEGYITASDLYFTVEADGTVKQSNGTLLPPLKMPDGTEASCLEMIDYAEENPNNPDSELPDEVSLTFKLAVVMLPETAEETEASGPIYLPGAKFVIKDAEGNVLKDGNGNPYTFTTEGKEMTLNLSPAIYGDLIKGMENDSQRIFRVVQLKAAEGYQFVDYSEAELTIHKDGEGKISLTLPDKQNVNNVLTFYNRKIPENAVGSITVTKRNYLGETDNQIYAANGATYYVALFADKDKTKRISEVKTIEIRKGYKAATVTFGNLPNGTYYVGETDQYGNLVGTVKDQALAKDPYYAEYVYGQDKNKVVIKADLHAQHPADPENVTIKNHYFNLPSDFTQIISLQITVNLRDENGVALNSKDTLYAGVYTKNSAGAKFGYAGKVAVKMGGAASKTVTVELPMSTDVKYVTARLVDANGKQLVNGAQYKMVINPSYLTLHKGDTQVQNITITADKVKQPETEPQTETEVDITKTKAELKLTKSVKYKGTSIRVNSVYYIGIFDDKELKNLRYKKAMVLNNASELTATLLVNLNKVPSGEVTFYFAEVDEEGNVLKSGKESGYDIDLNKNSITLSKKNMSDEVIVTNNVKSGSSVEQNLVNPGSGFAGDESALAAAQNLSNDSNSSGNTTTGDDSPILPLIIILTVSLLAVVVTAVITYKRRRGK